VRRRVRLVIGIVAVVLGVFATVGGLAIVLLVGPDGSVGIRPTRLLSSGYAVTLPQLSVPRLPGDRRVTLDVALRPTDTPLFVGVGPSSAVDAYLRDVPIDVIEQIDWPGAARTVAREGDARPTPPGGQSFWVVSARGLAPTLRWQAIPGDWTLVVMNVSASSSVDGTVTGSVTVPDLGPAGFVTLAVALAILGAGIWITARAARAPPS
jgi:hypothetical protein